VEKEMTPPLIELKYKRPVRGTVEKFYQATTCAYLDPSEWPGVPDAIKPCMRKSLLNLLVDDAVAAVHENTFDAVEDAHMSWTPMILDQRGWRDVAGILLRAMEDAIRASKESAERLLADDAKGISCTVSIMGYASANEDRKAGPSVEETKKRGTKKDAED
jgi:hypothetical protein